MYRAGSLMWVAFFCKKVSTRMIGSCVVCFLAGKLLLALYHDISLSIYNEGNCNNSHARTLIQRCSSRNIGRIKRKQGSFFLGITKRTDGWDKAVFIDDSNRCIDSDLKQVGQSCLINDSNRSIDSDLKRAGGVSKYNLFHSPTLAPTTRFPKTCSLNHSDIR